MVTIHLSCPSTPSCSPNNPSKTQSFLLPASTHRTNACKLTQSKAICAELEPSQASPMLGFTRILLALICHWLHFSSLLKYKQVIIAQICAALAQTTSLTKVMETFSNFQMLQRLLVSEIKLFLNLADLFLLVCICCLQFSYPTDFQWIAVLLRFSSHIVFHRIIMPLRLKKTFMTIKSAVKPSSTHSLEHIPEFHISHFYFYFF